MDGQQDGWTGGGQTDGLIVACQQPSPVFMPFPVQSLPAASCLNFPNWSMSPERSQIPPAWEDASLLVSHECHTALSSLPGDSG